ncbi:type IV toxin-antitoxin system AbiEi family antitoxin domain-containing protein [Kitasatospora sp. RB6PN24]|uniref:type IV toxin-antitoxin system AbiEi family antitoxin domain-containing protein n=1 Tax=Kitasatospora humi TaxID=2893891 RepID=UPI001E308021|nr:type IV toxin-antitoxin system AbiEi family antitoxin domain-containing protein [Kitasatospora humi]MCC9308559.1 type IV toxin-antitoxin system AbiEi family antitoxin domain-containing protein [Kitasatospora humi]
MSFQMPPTALSLEELARRQQNVITASQLRARGVPSRVVSEHCRRGGPWQRLLPRVYLLQPGEPTPEQRMWAALLYAAQNGREDGSRTGAVLTGAAALALYGFTAVPRLPAITDVEVLVPRQRRLRDVGEVRIRRTSRQLESREVHGLACAPVPRAVADALREWTDSGALDAGLLGSRGLRTVLREAVADGRADGPRSCPPAELLAELREAGLLSQPRIRAAVDELLAAERQATLGGVLELAAAELLPTPLTGPELRMRGGTFVAVPDLYWPLEGVAVEVDSALRCLSDGETAWMRAGQHRMAYLGVRVLHLTAEQVAADSAAAAEELRQALLLGATDLVELQVAEG